MHEGGVFLWGKGGPTCSLKTDGYLFLECSVCSTCSALTEPKSLWRGRGPCPGPGRELGPHRAFPSTAQHLGKSCPASTSTAEAAWQRGTIDKTSLLMVFTRHDQAAQSQLTFPLGWFLWSEMLRLKQEWGPSPATRALQKPLPSQHHLDPTGLPFLLPRPLPHPLQRQEA